MAKSAERLVAATPQAVAASILELRRRKIHPHFPGYLCVLRAAMAAGSRQDIKVNFKQFYDEFFAYGDAPKMRPYLTPFSGPRAKSSMFLNRNVAGSYAPGSIRPGRPLAQVISARGHKTDARYTLTEMHSSDALRNLLYGQRLPIVPFAIFLYRDYGFEVEEGKSDYQVFVTEFRAEFGFNASGDGAAAFLELFEMDTSYLQGVPIAEYVEMNRTP